MDMTSDGLALARSSTALRCRPRRRLARASLSRLLQSSHPPLGGQLAQRLGTLARSLPYVVTS